MIDAIDADLKRALLGGNKLEVSVLRGLKNALQNARIAKKSDLTDDEIVSVLRREAKQREEAALAFEKGGATDRADTERMEKSIIQKYLPQPMTEAEIKDIIETVLGSTGTDRTKTGEIIGLVIGRVKGRADGATVAKLVNERLRQ